MGRQPALTIPHQVGCEKGIPSTSVGFAGTYLQSQCYTEHIRFQKMYINMVPFSQTTLMKNELDGSRPLNLSRNLQELDGSTATALCDLLEAAVKHESESLQRYKSHQ